MTAEEPPITLHAMRERLAAQSRWASTHRSIVLRRQSDASYVHITERRADGGRVISWNPEIGDGRILKELLEEAAQDFEVRFGRAPGPNDPLVPSPYAKEPEEMTLDDWDRMVDDTIESTKEAGLRLEPLLAWRELGYLVTEMNVHLFSADEVRAFVEVVRRLEAEGYSNPG